MKYFSRWSNSSKRSSTNPLCRRPIPSRQANTLDVSYQCFFRLCNSAYKFRRRTQVEATVPSANYTNGLHVSSPSSNPCWQSGPVPAVGAHRAVPGQKHPNIPSGLFRGSLTSANFRRRTFKVDNTILRASSFSGTDAPILRSESIAFLRTGSASKHSQCVRESLNVVNSDRVLLLRRIAHLSHR